MQWLKANALLSIFSSLWVHWTTANSVPRSLSFLKSDIEIIGAIMYVVHRYARYKFFFVFKFWIFLENSLMPWRRKNLLKAFLWRHCNLILNWPELLFRWSYVFTKTIITFSTVKVYTMGLWNTYNNNIHAKTVISDHVTDKKYSLIISFFLFLFFSTFGVGDGRHWISWRVWNVARIPKPTETDQIIIKTRPGDLVVPDPFGS